MEEKLFHLILGAKIREARKAKGLNQEQFAQLINRSRVSVVNIEKGRQQPSVYMLSNIAEVLGINVDEIFPSPKDAMSHDNWDEKLTNEKRITSSQRGTVLKFITGLDF